MMNVKANLLRRVGTPTQGWRVTFRAFDADNREFGTFQNVQRSQADGTATAVFMPGGGGRIGRARIEVTAEGTQAVGTAAFELQAPAAGS